MNTAQANFHILIHFELRREADGEAQVRDLTVITCRRVSFHNDAYFFFYIRVSQVNREILAVMEPLGPREKGATRALLVHEDSQVLLVLKVQKEKKEPQETRDDLGLMDERATRVMQ